MTTIDEKFAPAQTSTAEPDNRTPYQRAVDGEPGYEPLAVLRQLFGDWQEAAEYAKNVNARVEELRSQIGHLLALSGVNVHELDGYELRITAPAAWTNYSAKTLEAELKRLRDDGLVSNEVLERIRKTGKPGGRAGGLRIESMESIERRFGR